MSLSTHLLTSLRERDPSSALFQLFSPEGDLVSAVNKSAWINFCLAIKKKTCVIDISEKSTDGCDVAIITRETYHSSLVESACIALGLVFCPLNPDDPEYRLNRLTDMLKPRITLVNEEIKQLLRESIDKAELKPDVEVDVSDFLVPLSDDQLAYYIFTSGSTGDPKAIRATRGNIYAYVTDFVFNPKGLGFFNQPTFLTLSTPFFDPSIGDMAATILRSDALQICVAHETLLGGSLLKVLLAAAPTHVITTPLVWGTVLLPPTESILCSHLGLPIRVYLGGERMSQKVIDHWASRVELYNIYGVTEVTVYQTLQRVYPGDLAENVTCGHTTGKTRLWIDSIDDGDDNDNDGHSFESGKLLASGEVVLEGPQVCAGYYGETQSTGAFSVNDVTGQRTFRTGDVGIVRCRKNFEGEDETVLEIKGRRDWQIKLNGQRVAIEEVETTIQSTLKVLFKECCCVAVKGEATQIGIAGVLSDGNTSANELEVYENDIVIGLRLAIEAYLPHHMVPSLWWLICDPEKLPRTSTGKVNRQLVRQKLKRKHDLRDQHCSENCICSSDSLAARSFYENVRSIWSGFFGIPIHCKSNFFHAGGDSLGSLKLSRMLYVALNDGSCDGIDMYGTLPNAFRPQLLLCHPQLSDYVCAVRSELAKSNDLIKEDASLAHLDDQKKLTSSRFEPHLPAFLNLVAGNYITLVDFLLTHNLVSVNGNYSREHPCTTPLHTAANLGNLKMMELLIHHGAKVSAVTADGVSPAHLAAAHATPSVLRTLLDQKAPLQARDSRYQSLLHFSAREGNRANTHLLLYEYGLDLRLRDKWQRTAAHWALLNGHSEVLEELVAFTNSTEVLPSDSFTRGTGKARFTRLARKRTHLEYESLIDMTKRLYPDDAKFLLLSTQLANTLET